MTDHDPYSYPPRGMGRDEAARYLGVPVTTFEGLVAAGSLPPARHIGGVVLWDRLALDAAFNTVATIDAGPAPSPVQAFTPATGAALDVFLPKTLAKRWGCSEGLVRRLCQTGELPSFQLGGKLLRIKRSDVEAFERATAGEALVAPAAPAEPVAAAADRKRKPPVPRLDQKPYLRRLRSE